ncbi:MAG: hypothetical protein FJ109_14605, partial [Deltaproteobacteria bacterium]|nr:hypothetical protein [Deltaproteobacteria bacterium]
MEAWMTWPVGPLLAAGDVVAVVAPASPPDPGKLEAGLAVLSGWGLRPELLWDRHADNEFLAGPE